MGKQTSKQTGKGGWEWRKNQTRAEGTIGTSGGMKRERQTGRRAGSQANGCGLGRERAAEVKKGVTSIVGLDWQSRGGIITLPGSCVCISLSLFLTLAVLHRREHTICYLSLALARARSAHNEGRDVNKDLLAVCFGEY